MKREACVGCWLLSMLPSACFRPDGIGQDRGYLNDSRPSMPTARASRSVIARSSRSTTMPASSA